MLFDHEKQPRAADALANGGMISVQVLNEFANVVRNKCGRSWGEVEAALSVIERRFRDVQAITHATHLAARKLAKEHGLNIYDSLIVVAALEAKCSKLFSENLQHGRQFGRLEVVNPFM